MHRGSRAAAMAASASDSPIPRDTFHQGPAPYDTRTSTRSGIPLNPHIRVRMVNAWSGNRVNAFSPGARAVTLASSQPEPERGHPQKREEADHVRDGGYKRA